MANTPTESTNIADKSTLKNWFKTGLKPLQNHFWMWLDSYWHKSEAIPITSIDGLANAIEGKASANHAHSEYATNDASSLTEVNIEAWRSQLGISTTGEQLSVEIDGVVYSVLKGVGNTTNQLENGDLVFNVLYGGNVETILMRENDSWKPIGQTIEF